MPRITPSCSRFLALYFVFYVASRSSTSVAHRSPVKDPVDGLLVFGVPPGRIRVAGGAGARRFPMASRGARF
jgi:hypothetical protein